MDKNHDGNIVPFLDVFRNRDVEIQTLQFILAFRPVFVDPKKRREIIRDLGTPRPGTLSSEYVSNCH